MEKMKPTKIHKKSHLVDDPQVVQKNLQELETFREYYDSCNSVRSRRTKNRKYYRGDQWHELINNPDVEGEVITEEDYIKDRGKIPFKQNIIRQLVKNVLGQYRMNPNKSLVVARDRDEQKTSEMMNCALEVVNDMNRMSSLNTRNYEEFLLSGMAIGKVSYDWIRERQVEDVRKKNVSVQRIFFNSDVQDVRLLDLRVIGEIHDFTMDEILLHFAKTRADEEKIKLWYGIKSGEENIMINNEGLSANQFDHIDFFIPLEITKCRVIEAWTLKASWKTYVHDYMDGSYKITDTSLKEIKNLNEERIRIGLENGELQENIPLLEAEEKRVQLWHVKFYTPYGHTLFESETPYYHGEHPYAVLLYPLLDGEVWSLVEDIIDQQRYINRLISLLDFIIGASAKGVLLFPESAKPDDMSMDEIADEWTKYDGIIKYKAKPGVPVPEQISSNSTNIGAHELLAVQLKFMQEISGVSPAIQGHNPSAGTPSSLYAQEAQNATINIKDYMDSFTEYQRVMDQKTLQLIQQFYQTKRYLSISGRDYDDMAKNYDPEKVKNLLYDVNIVQGLDTPMYRQMIEDTLNKLLDGGYIDITMYLENSTIPFADKLLDQINARNDKILADEQPGQLSPELLAQVQGGLQNEMNPNSNAIVGHLTRPQQN